MRLSHNFELVPLSLLETPPSSFLQEIRQSDLPDVMASHLLIGDSPLSELVKWLAPARIFNSQTFENAGRSFGPPFDAISPLEDFYQNGQSTFQRFVNAITRNSSSFIDFSLITAIASDDVSLLNLTYSWLKLAACRWPLADHLDDRLLGLTAVISLYLASLSQNKTCPGYPDLPIISQILSSNPSALGSHPLSSSWLSLYNIDLALETLGHAQAILASLAQDLNREPNSLNPFFEPMSSSPSHPSSQSESPDEEFKSLIDFLLTHERRDKLLRQAKSSLAPYLAQLAAAANFPEIRQSWPRAAFLSAPQATLAFIAESVPDFRRKLAMHREKLRSSETFALPEQAPRIDSPSLGLTRPSDSFPQERDGIPYPVAEPPYPRPGPSSLGHDPLASKPASPAESPANAEPAATAEPPANAEPAATAEPAAPIATDQQASPPGPPATDQPSSPEIGGPDPTSAGASIAELASLEASSPEPLSPAAFSAELASLETSSPETPSSDTPSSELASPELSSPETLSASPASSELAPPEKISPKIELVGGLFPKEKAPEGDQKGGQEAGQDAGQEGDQEGGQVAGQRSGGQSGQKKGQKAKASEPKPQGPGPGSAPAGAPLGPPLASPFRLTPFSFPFPASPSHLPAMPVFAFHLAEEPGGQAALDMSLTQSAYKAFFAGDPPAANFNDVIEINPDGTPFTAPAPLEEEEEDEEDHQGRVQALAEYLTLAEELAPNRLFSDSDPPGLEASEFEELLAKLTELNVKSEIALHGPKAAAFMSMAEDKLISQNDPRALYWLSMVERPAWITFCPSWLAEMLCLGLAFPLSPPEAAKNRLKHLIEEEAYYKVELLSERHAVLLAAAVIRPSAILCDLELSELSQSLSEHLKNHPPLRDLLIQLSDLSKNAQPLLGPHTMSRTAKLNLLESRKKELNRLTDDWLENAWKKRCIYAQASIVWRHLTERGELAKIVTECRAGGDEHTLKELKEKTSLWRYDDYAFSRIEEVHKQNRPKATTTIDFTAKAQLLNMRTDAINLAESWLAHHHDDREAGSLKGDHYQKNLDLLSKRAAEVLSYLESLPEDSKIQGAGLLAPALKELSDKYEGLMEESFVSIDLGAGLTEAEARRYAWLGRIPGLKDPPPVAKLRFGAQTPFLSRLTLPAVCLGLSLNEPAYTRVRGQIEDKRFHMASLEIALSPALGGDKPANGKIDPKKSQAQSALKTLLASEGKKSLRLLKDSLSSMKSKIEGSKFWGGLEDEKRDELRVRLRSLERDHAAISNLEEAKLAEPAHAFELSELFRDLSDIDLAIHDHLSIATDELEGRLGALKRIIPQGAYDLIESLIKDGELLSAHDQLGLVEESLSLNLPVKAPAPVVHQTLAARFYNRLDEIHKIKELQSTRDPLNTLARTGLKPTREGMEIYSMFVSLHPANERVWDLRALPAVLSWLGFRGAESQRFEASFPAPPLDLAKIVLSGVSFESPLPKWGSQAQSFQLLLGYGEIKADDVISMLRGVSSSFESPVIVLALSKMAKRSREKLGTLLKEKSLSPLVLDLNLMAFLAGIKSEDRTKALIQAGLSQGPYNPYLEESSVLLPTEMRFGREDLIERLWSPDGPALVHGGRGMGKTVIFSSLIDQKRRPQNGALAARIVAKPGLSLPELIIEAMRKEGLLSSSQSAASKLPDYVKSLFDRSSGQKLERLLIIVEDSDFLLERGKSAQFKQLSNLAALMAETGGRFKVILSGLSAVQRLRHYPDNPFKNFGQPLCVGPLPISDGHDLVVVPMEAVGLTFERSALVQRVLSMANHHPGLIQLFCHALVDFAQAKGIFKITGQDIDEVYAQKAVRKEMVERFDRAIDLDPRYKAAALAIASADLEGEGEGRAGREGQELSVHEILDKAREIWPAAFKDMDADGLESLMLEMRDIGLVRSIFGRHALRSPHVLPLLTGGDDPSLALKSFQGKKFDPKPGPEGLRRAIAGDFFPMPSPMVFSQESDLLGWGSGLTLLVGSKALGLDKVRDCFKSIEESADPGVKPKIISLKMMPPAKRLEEIKRIFSQEANSFGRPILVLVDSLTGLEAPDQLPELTANFWRLIETAAHWLHKTGAGAKSSFKVVGLVHPDAWLSKVAEDRSLGDDVDVRFLERLSLSGLEQFLASSALSGAGAKGLIQRTGGWHSLVLGELAAKYAPQSPLAQAEADFRLLAGPLAPGRPVEACLEVLTIASEAEMAVTFGQLEEEVAALLEKKTGAPAHKRVIRPLLEALARLSLIAPKHPESGGDLDTEAAWRLDRHYLESLTRPS